MKTSDIARRSFLANPELRLIDIPKLAAQRSGVTVTHGELAEAVKAGRAEYRAQRRLPPKR